MPAYDYRCQSCGYEAEVIQRLSEFQSERDCTECCSGKMTVVISSNPGVMWNCGGSTRSFASKNLPKNATGGHNPGHNPPSLQSLGLDAEDGKKLGL